MGPAFPGIVSLKLSVNPKGSWPPLTSVTATQIPANAGSLFKASFNPLPEPGPAAFFALGWVGGGRGPSHQVARVVLQCEQSGSGPECPESMCPAPGAGWVWVSQHGK